MSPQSTIEASRPLVEREADRSRLRDEADGALLRRFVSDRDEAAFEALVLRHGPGVLRVCRQWLGDGQDAEDAFQATFLILVNRAGAIRQAESLDSWLRGVARRVSGRA